MNQQIERIRYAIATVLAAVALATIVWTLATAAPDTSPPELPTATIPAPDLTPGATVEPYPGPPTPSAYPGPYPAPVDHDFLPFQADGQSYP